MDYPHPVVELDPDGNVELRNAYPSGIGAWDKVWIRYGYGQFSPGTDVDAALEGILLEAAEEGLTFISDQDARPPGSAHPNVHLWDNGADAALELERMMEVRRVALARFGERAIKTGMPLATMEEALVPLYLHHRYQAEATVKVVGGQYYTYAMRGDGQTPRRSVPASEQEKALEAILGTLRPEALALPKGVLEILPPRPFRYGAHQELFHRNTGLVFDAVAPASAAADMVLALLLHPERAARLVQQQALEPALPGLDDVLERTATALFAPTFTEGYEAEINRAVERVFVDRAMTLSARAPMAQVRALTTQALLDLRHQLEEGETAEDEANRAHYLLLRQDIDRFMARPHETLQVPEAPAPPPGSPIGDPGMNWADGRFLLFGPWDGAGYDWWW
jgi:hypothetical protein